LFDLASEALLVRLYSTLAVFSCLFGIYTDPLASIQVKRDDDLST